MARSGSGISAIFASTSLSPSGLPARWPRRAGACSSWAPLVRASLIESYPQMPSAAHAVLRAGQNYLVTLLGIQPHLISAVGPALLESDERSIV